MRLFRLILSAVLWLTPVALAAQQNTAALGSQAASETQPDVLPDAPSSVLADVPVYVASSMLAEQQTQQTAPAPATPAQNPAPAPAAQSSASPQPSSADKGQHETAEEQMKEQETQRVLGIVPNFNTTYRNNAVSLTAGQKMRLAFRTSIDPFTFAGAFMVAGYGEVVNNHPGFGWGAEGYFKRSGAAYLDSFNGTMIGNGLLPALLHQDPRYFRMGQGTITHRILYSAATSFICKHDNTGKWEPNYSNVLGNIASGAISNFYYPASKSGIGLTIANGMIQTAEGAIGAEFNEFWPDISRKLFHRDPTHGLDAAAQAEDAKKKHAQGNNQQ
jgi:hypothetical protein